MRGSQKKKLVKIRNHSNMTSCFDEFFWPNFPEISQFPHDPWGWLPIGTVFYVRIRKNSLNYEIILIWRPILTTFFWSVNCNGDRRPEVKPQDDVKPRKPGKIIKKQSLVDYNILCNAQKKRTTTDFTLGHNHESSHDMNCKWDNFSIRLLCIKDQRWSRIIVLVWYPLGLAMYRGS